MRRSALRLTRRALPMVVAIALISAAPLQLNRIAVAETGADSTQLLQPQRSVVRFTLESQFMQLSGRLTEFSGSVTAARANGAPLEVDLRVNIGAVDLDPQPAFQMLNPDSLFRAIPNPVTIFRSKRIVPVNRNTFRIQGKLIRAGKAWDLDVPITLLRRTPTESEYLVKMRGDVLGDDLPLLQSGGADGSLEGRLIFAERPRS